MNGFISFAEPLQKFLNNVVQCNESHARWLNTLSYMENCGARKIAACEHPTLVKEEMLKHASEEFRHAHYLKRQIGKITSIPMEDYSRAHILGGTSTLHYLSQLDVKTSRYLAEAQKMANSEIKAAAYLLVTYAIELRAEELYPIYDEVLRKMGSKVAVRSILLEEKEHLQEMREGLSKLQNGEEHAKVVCGLESELCCKWISELNS